MKTLRVLILPFAIILCWTALSTANLIDPIFLPSPWRVATALFSGLASGDLIGDLFATLGRSLVGFFAAAVIGVPLGLLIGRAPELARTTQPTIDFFRSIPATALFPLFLFAFGLGDTAKVAIVVYACSLIILVNTAYGAMQVKASRIQATKVMGASSADIFGKIVVPESAPGIFAGLRIALSLSFVLIVVTEMFIGTSVGLGHEIMNAQSVYRTPEMYAAIILTGILGYFANRLILVVEATTLHWVGR